MKNFRSALSFGLVYFFLAQYVIALLLAPSVAWHFILKYW